VLQIKDIYFASLVRTLRLRRSFSVRAESFVVKNTYETVPILNVY